MSSGKKWQILVPRMLTWDKLVSLYLKVFTLTNWRGWRFSGVQSSVEIFFDGETRPGGHYIDLDVELDYKKRGLGSATEVVVSSDGLVDAVPGTQRLVELMNFNNSTGKLKTGYPQSLVWLIRELGATGGENPSHSARMQAIDLLWPAVHAFVEATARNADEVGEMGNPFTLLNLKRLLTIAGLSEQEARKFWEPIERKFQVTSNARHRANEKAQSIHAQTFEVPILRSNHTGEGHLIHTDDTRVAKPYFKGHPEVLILVVRRQSGNTAILCRGKQDLHRLAQELQRLEPGKWHHETRYESPMLLNGSSSREVPPTSLKDQVLMELIKKLYQHHSRGQQ